MGRRLPAVLSAEWRWVLDRKWNSERPLVFAHVVLTKTLGSRKAREIWARIDHQLDLLGRGIHACLVGDALAEVRSREGRVKRRLEEEKDCLARSFHSTVLLGNLRQAVRWATKHEGGRVSSPGRCLHEDRVTGFRYPPGESP